MVVHDDDADDDDADDADDADDDGGDDDDADNANDDEKMYWRQVQKSGGDAATAEQMVRGISTVGCHKCSRVERL